MVGADHSQRDEDDVAAPARVAVLVADDNARYRAGIVRALGRRGDLEVVAEAEDGIVALELTRRLAPAVVLADVRMPGLDGLALARAVTADPALGDVRVLLLSARHDPALEAEAAAAGAVGCVDKGETRGAIADAVGRAAPGALRTP